MVSILLGVGVCVFVTFSRSIFCKLSSYWNWQWQSYLGICWQQKSSQFIAYMYIQNSSMYLARFCLQRPLFWGSFWKFLLVSRTFPGEKAARSYSKKKSVFMLANLRFFKPARLFYQIPSFMIYLMSQNLCPKAVFHWIRQAKTLLGN